MHADFAHQLARDPLRPALDEAGVVRMKRQSLTQHRDVAINLADRRLHHPDARQRHVEFLSHQHGERGHDALPHLAARQHDGHLALRRHHDPAIER